MSRRSPGAPVATHSVNALRAHVRDVELATLAKVVPRPESYTFEFKYDGYRMLAFRGSDGLKLVSRNRQDWTDTFPTAASALARVKSAEFIIDGEMCVVDERGIPRFQRMQRRGPMPENVVYVAFDLLWQDGVDLRGKPIEERRRRLAALIVPGGTGLALSSAVEGDPAMLLELARRNELEGIVAKRKASLYVAGRSRDWLKLKCTRRQAFVVIGYRRQGGTRCAGSLLLALYDPDGELTYAGRVGTGLDDRERVELAKFFDAHAVPEAPARGVPTAFARGARWAAPVLVVEVEFLEWTDDGQARHPSYRGIRIDKAPADCRREG